MPYEVTAARKRPQSFEQLAGQEFVAATLEKSLETGRIAHAYLFSGPRGCGKTSTARILAKALNCEKGLGSHPCGACDSCKSITSGASLDVIEIDGASNTSVDNVRQIKDEVLFPPNSSRYKIYIIDEVHMLSTSAFNALLKTIEEPPPYVVFMFATTEPHKVPATIKSRCQQFSFRLVSAEVIRELLGAACAELGVAAEDEALLWIARESGGSIRDAYTLFDQVVSFAEGNITAALIREKLGLVGQDRMNALFGAFVAGDTPGALSRLDDILSSGVSPEQFVADAVEFARALLLIAHGIVRESLLGAPLASFDRAIVEALGGEKIERVLSIFLSSYRGLKDSIDPRYELDLAVAKASHIASYVAPSELAGAVAAMKSMLDRPVARGNLASQSRQVASAPTAASVPESASIPQRTPAFAPEPVTAQPQPAASSSARSLDEIKRDLVSEIRKSNVLLATTLEKSRDWILEGNVLKIAVSTAMEIDLLKRFVGILAEVLAQISGVARKIEVVAAGAPRERTQPAPTSPSEPEAAPAQDRTPRQFRESDPRPAVPVSAAPVSAAPSSASLSGADRDRVALVERYFKGTMKSVVAVASTGNTAPSVPLAGSRTAGGASAASGLETASGPETETEFEQESAD